MVKVRAAEPDDKIEIERLTEMALGISAAGKGEEVPGAERRIWLAWAGEGEGAASPAGFCRIVPDRESSARGWLCLDAIFVSPDDRRKGLGRALIEEAKGAARSGGLAGVNAFLPADFPERFVKDTGGAKVRSLLLLRAENLETRPPSPPRMATASAPFLCPGTWKSWPPFITQYFSTCGISAPTVPMRSPIGSTPPIASPRIASSPSMLPRKGWRLRLRGWPCSP